MATLVGRHWLQERPVKAKAWLKHVSLRIERGHAIDSDTLQRMQAVVAPARRRILPEEGHRLHLVVEMCNAKRPTATLVGSHERYQETSARLMEAFQARVGSEWAGTSDYQLNPPPASLPHHFLSAKEGLRYLGTGDPLRGGAAFSAATRDDVRKGRQAVTHTVPPRLQLYPRLGAFEVTALLFDGDALVRPRPPPAPAPPAPTPPPPLPPPRRASCCHRNRARAPPRPFPSAPSLLMRITARGRWRASASSRSCSRDAGQPTNTSWRASTASSSKRCGATTSRRSASSPSSCSTGTRCSMRSCSGCARRWRPVATPGPWMMPVCSGDHNLGRRKYCGGGGRRPWALVGRTLVAHWRPR
jgi:hypothetical protein